ncbi:MAG: alanine--tRNA ligase [Candidatus Bostrichicola ureolyticus]|nr:MAG: alanine--tRNA ligase [Candidatus Bostrichicola ureolyticus]
MKDDPTLLFANAGMNQFKDYFLDNKKINYTRIANTQKCLRITGKHNDLNNVGYDNYHHTMFEMLGNWSFGDYFKEEAIYWAWELLTEIYNISKEDIYVTIFNGDVKDKLPLDKETYKFWKNIINDNHILFFEKEYNFWEMGLTGPCGPCSEIHIDLRSNKEKIKIPGYKLINKGNPKVIEIWNIVFIEFLRKEDGTLEKLPRKHVDTGLGFERLCRIIQKKSSNYDTDIFMPLIKDIEKYTGNIYGIETNKDIAIRIIADHIRAIAFAISDGKRPSNTGAGYVIRRILRRAMSYAYSFLEQKNPFIYKLVDTLAININEVFPEINNNKYLIKEVIKEEENSFIKIIDNGLIRIKEIIKEFKNKKIIDGERIFELYDTYGFPYDFSYTIAKKNNLIIDNSGFKKKMLEQKQRSKKNSIIQYHDWIKINNTNDKYSYFVGYDQLETYSKIIKYRLVETSKDKYYQIVLDKTPFYPESGGQVGDIGFIINNDEKICILNTKKENDLILHIVSKIPNNPHNNLKAIVDVDRRKKIEKNHTATHLLHYVLKNILGNHVEQRGSYVGPDKIRFDFSNSYKLNSNIIEIIESNIEEMINKGFSLEEKRNISLKQALKDGAIALFGNKYGNIVRTIKFGNSIELCIGTHVSNTKDIQLFKIISESSIALGIRRIEAITSINAIKYLKDIYKKYNIIINNLKHPIDPIKAINNIINTNKILKLKLNNFVKKQLNILKNEWISRSEKINSYTIIMEYTDLDFIFYKSLILELRKNIFNLCIIIININNNNEIVFCTALSDNLIKNGIDARLIINLFDNYIFGKGCGHNFFAMIKGKLLRSINIDLIRYKIHNYLNNHK